jgi:glucose-1-phosphatase
MGGSLLRAVIFDIGRVLVRVDVARAMQGLAKGIDLSPGEIWSAIEKDPRWRDWQEGRISPRDWHLHLTRKLSGSLTFEEFCEAWNRALDPQPMQDSALFESLAKRYRLGLLSNTDPIHVAHLEATYAFFRYFPQSARTYSCVVNASKPVPLVFREAMRGVKAEPEETLYVDDIEAYVEAARGLGMRGVHYESPEQLIVELEKVGALRPGELAKISG